MYFFSVKRNSVILGIISPLFILITIINKYISKAFCFFILSIPSHLYLRLQFWYFTKQILKHSSITLSICYLCINKDININLYIYIFIYLFIYLSIHPFIHSFITDIQSYAQVSHEQHCGHYLPLLSSPHHTPHYGRCLLA